MDKKEKKMRINIEGLSVFVEEKKKKKRNWEEEESIYVTCKFVLILDCYLRLTLIERLNYSPINLYKLSYLS